MFRFSDALSEEQRTLGKGALRQYVECSLSANQWRVILLVLPSPAPRRPLAALSSSPIRTGIGSSSAMRETTWITGIQARKQNHPTLVLEAPGGLLRSGRDHGPVVLCGNGKIRFHH